MKIPSFKKPTRFLMVVVFGVSLFLSCKKQDNGGGTSTRDTAPDLATTVNATIKGFITDENDSAVRNTMVQVGNTAVTTDNYGYFEALDATVVQSAAVVTVSRPGYFKSIKTFSVTTGKSIFTRIKLIPKTKAGSVNAVAGVATFTAVSHTAFGTSFVLNAASTGLIGATSTLFDIISVIY